MENNPYQQPQDTNQPPISAPPVQSQPQPVQPPVFQQPVQPVQPPYPQAAGSNGKGLGIASIIFGVLSWWLIGLPLGIASLMKASKAGASKVLGIIGIVLNVLAIPASIIVLMVVLTAFANVQQRAKDAAAQGQSTSTTQSSTGSSSSSADIPLTSSWSPGQGKAYWQVPASMAGWTPLKIDQGGVNEFKNDSTGEVLLTYQGSFSSSATTDASLTTDLISQMISQNQGTAASGAPGTMNFKQVSNGKTVEFATQEFSFTLSDGSPGKGIVAARGFKGEGMSVLYLSSAPAFSQTTWNTFTSQASLNDGVY